MTSAKLVRAKYACLFFFCILAWGCSQQRLLKKAAAVPRTGERYEKLPAFEQDAELLIGYIQKAYPLAEVKMSSSLFDSAANAFRAEVRTAATTNEFRFCTQRFLAKLKDGHTFVTGIDYSTPTGRIFPWRLLPIQNEIFISNIGSNYDSSLIGAKIRSINGVSVASIIARVGNYESGENIDWKLQVARGKFAFPGYWKAIGLSHHDTLQIVVEKNETISSVTLASQTPRELKMNSLGSDSFRKKASFSTNIDSASDYAYLQMNTNFDYPSLKNSIDGYLVFPAKWFALRLAKKKLPTDFGHTIESFFTEIDKNKIGNIVLDLRYNTGGEPLLNKQFLYYLASAEKVNDEKRYIWMNEVYQKTFVKKYKKQRGPYASYDADHPDLLYINEKFQGAHFYDDLLANKNFHVNSAIPKFKGNLYVLTGPATFSAGSLLAMLVQENHLGQLIGSCTGNNIPTQSIYNSILLPRSSTLIQVSTGYVLPPSGKSTDRVCPDIATSIRLTDILNRRDTDLDMVLTMINARY
ncbi:MAG: hypothetical protein JSS79_11320 [Bacteroidetes bacterium]|nr:hypothetical protein [Bacteroidota bacterium]